MRAQGVQDKASSSSEHRYRFSNDLATWETIFSFAASLSIKLYIPADLC